MDIIGTNRGPLSHEPAPPSLRRMNTEVLGADAESQAPGAASSDIHVLSHVDATEPIIEPFATNDLSDFLQATRVGKGRVTADVSIDREAHPLKKAGAAAAHAGAAAAPMVAGHVLAGLTTNPVMQAVIYGATALGTLILGGHAVQAIQNGMSAASDVIMPEKVWSGHQEIHMENGERKVEVTSDQARNEAGKIADYLSEKMRAYPSGHTVIHMAGHGLMYHAVAGLPGEDFTQVMQQVREKSGRPVDVLWLESCLSGNLETLSAIKNCARYVIASEESVGTGTVGRMLDRTLSEKDAQDLSARELADRLVKNAAGDESVMTLALVDMEQLPNLEKAVDRLGKDLLGEMETGHGKGLRNAVKGTTLFPKGDLEARILEVGDLAGFARQVEHEWSPEGAEAGSPRARQLQEDAKGVLEALDRAVARIETSPSYADVGGISIQLPGSKRVAFDREFGGPDAPPGQRVTPYAKASSPPAWRHLVDTVSNRGRR